MFEDIIEYTLKGEETLEGQLREYQDIGTPEEIHRALDIAFKLMREKQDSNRNV